MDSNLEYKKQFWEKPYHKHMLSFAFDFRIDVETNKRGLIFGYIPTIEDRYLIAQMVATEMSNDVYQIPKEFIEKYNPVNIEEQRVLNAFKQDLTKH